MTQLDVVTPGAIGPRLARAAGLAGLVFALLFSVAFTLLRVDAPPVGAAALDAWWASSRDRLAVGTYLVPFAGITVIWFAAALRRRIGHAEGLFFATAFLGSALIFVSMLFVAGPSAGAILASAQLEEPSQRQVVAAMGQALAYAVFFGFAVKMAAMFMLAVASIGRSAD